jgi:hypothetical protein
MIAFAQAAARHSFTDHRRSARFVTISRAGRIEASAVEVSASSGVGLDSQAVVHGNPELLLAQQPGPA